ncbi:hypothetical protein FQ192_17980 [Pseudomonas sp. ANT_J12]|nr:hypothetical protein FQ192_17980 [Pseudomonas sp. ANT_J12]
MIRTLSFRREQGDTLLLPHDPSSLTITASQGPASLVICRFWFDASSFQAMLFALPWLIHIKHQPRLQGVFRTLATGRQQPRARLKAAILVLICQSFRSRLLAIHPRQHVLGIRRGVVVDHRKVFHQLEVIRAM